MNTLTASVAQAKLDKLIDQVASTHEPIQIIGKRSSAILISEDDWRALQETLHLLSIPGMRESIRAGLKAPVGKLSSNCHDFKS
ncbi:MAG TPA: type II toxin-antitoxin system Phd/YefM family antitoxin [Elusimicrobiota bacterium]|nr:type II toxin-antitoxin system Phd/YefM family antitoxin [Elusimicrobiota bacterium]